MSWRKRFDLIRQRRRAPAGPGDWRRTLAIAMLAWIASAPAAWAQEAANVPNANAPNANVPAAAARHVAAQMADLGTPAFVDGLAGLLVLHAGRDRAVAGAIGRQVVTAAPAAGGQVARALRLAGFDPAVAGLDGGAAGPDPAAEPPAPVAVSVAGGRPAGSPDLASARAPAASERVVAPAASVRGLAPLSGSAGPTWAQQTSRPGPGDLGTPQLR